MKKILAVAAALALILGVIAIFAAREEKAPTPPATTNENSTPGSKPQGAGTVYYLNFKPEQARQWEELARIYTAETGVPVTVRTAASGTYEDTLRSEIEKPDAPTLFQVNGPMGLKTWKGF